MDTVLEDFRNALETLDALTAERLFHAAVDESSPIAAVERLVSPALAGMGMSWQEGSVALSQVYMAGRLCEQLVERVLPPSDPDRKHQPRSAIVVLNDYHMLGKRIVYSVMRASGFELFDYGRMDVEELVRRAQADHLSVLMISVLMLPSALRVREVCQRLRAGGQSIRVLVGGAPFLFDEQLWREVGADAMGRNSGEAVAIVEGWMGAGP